MRESSGPDHPIGPFFVCGARFRCRAPVTPLCGASRWRQPINSALAASRPEQYQRAIYPAARCHQKSSHAPTGRLAGVRVGWRKQQGRRGAQAPHLFCFLVRRLRAPPAARSSTNRSRGPYSLPAGPGSPEGSPSPRPSAVTLVTWLLLQPHPPPKLETVSSSSPKGGPTKHTRASGGGDKCAGAARFGSGVSVSRATGSAGGARRSQAGRAPRS